MHDINEIDDLRDRLDALIRLTIEEAAEVAQLIRDSNDAEIYDSSTGVGSSVDQQNDAV